MRGAFVLWQSLFGGCYEQRTGEGVSESEIILTHNLTKRYGRRGRGIEDVLGYNNSGASLPLHRLLGPLAC